MCITNLFKNMEIDNFADFKTKFEKFIKKPDKYLSIQESQAEEIKKLTENLYNFTKNNEREDEIPEALPKLFIKNLDEEQIWQQIELQNNAVSSKLVTDISHFLAKNDLTFSLKTEKNTKKPCFDDSTEINTKKVRFDDSTEKDSEMLDVQPKSLTKVKVKNTKPSIVDDKFFKLHEMEEFLEKFEKEEEESEEDLDYFQDEELDDEEQLHYNDFFDQPDEELISKPKCNKTVTFDMSEEEDDRYEHLQNNEDSEFDDNSAEGKDNDDFNETFGKNNREIKDNVPKEISTFEARQDKLKSRIKNLENAALKEKPWQLKGEVTANCRPQNSLLEEYVEFDIATRPAPVLTEKSTIRLEDIILQRIKDKAWDDVVRKIKPIQGDLEYKKRIVLDQEKSKLSLAQIYEKEYLNQLDKKNESVIDKPEVEAPEHKEIRIMMNKLFAKLDALSNFHFTPKQVKEEVKIISNVPAINMEEVAPVATSHATLLAPEEVKPKSKGEYIGKNERTATDKKRERRLKKIKQQSKFKQMSAKEKEKLQKNSTGNKNISQKLLQKITKSRNVTQLEHNEGGKYIKSSKVFFSKLQDETNSQVKKGVGYEKTKAKKQLKKKKNRSK